MKTIVANQGREAAPERGRMGTVIERLESAAFSENTRAVVYTTYSGRSDAAPNERMTAVRKPRYDVAVARWHCYLPAGFAQALASSIQDPGLSQLGCTEVLQGVIRGLESPPLRKGCRPKFSRKSAVCRARQFFNALLTFTPKSWVVTGEFLA
jgi:hypothetical protein